jgi:hypothetical protein
MKYFKSLKRLRPDALMLAVIMFLQTISPVFLFGGEHERSNADNIRYNFHSELNSKIKEKKVIPLANDDELNVKSNITNTIFEVIEPKTKTHDVALVKPGGPDQPEVQGFTPISSDGMVDPFTGDFSYNIPLLEVDGYPINIAYSAGIGMEQEASWVGLGWSLNPGVVNRNMRGIPDDFSGDEIVQEYNQKDNWTAGASAGINLELFSIDGTNIAGGLSASQSIEYNNYSGFNSSFSIGPSFEIAGETGLEVGLNYTGSSQGGVTIGANVALSDGNKRDDKVINKLSIGSSFNSRQGLQQSTINYSKEVYLNRTGRHSTANGGGGSYNHGMSTFVPQIAFSTNANSFTGRFKLGPDVVGLDGTISFTGFFSKSSLKYKTRTLQAYGYMNLQNGYLNENAMLDFNRENESNFTKNTPALPIPHLMYDIYSVSGQGISGSYRLDRQDIGYVFDPKITSGTNSFSLGGEVGLGATFKAGVDVGAVFTKAHSGVWKDDNKATGVIKYNSKVNYFRDANELAFDNSDYNFNNIGGSESAHFKLNGPRSLDNTIITKSNVKHQIRNVKSTSFKRNQPLTSLTVREVKDGYGITRLPSNSYANVNAVNNNHVGAFNVTKTDGSRYFYGLPAYSIKQKNVSFAVGEGASPKSDPDWDTRLVGYSAQDASIANKRGLDNHYNAQTIPAYIHSYMLTAVLGSDYMDSDDITGPTKDDLGSYIEFKYKHVQNYKWRNPIQADSAFHDNGLNADPTDNKANYIYGEKELWYLDTIKGKNHLLIFHTSDRKDAVSVNSESGGLNISNPRMLKLDSIKLYSIPDFEENGSSAIPIKTVHFRYDYRLMRNYSGNLEKNSTDVLKGGKLTLSKVYFTYENSYKGERSPYEFKYGFNPKYNPNSIDRWGTYKRNPTGLSSNGASGPLSNSDFPYVGHDKDSSDVWASAWNLNEIKLPSGGKIEVFYESDTYAYVQHKKAQQMFKIVDVEGCDYANCSISDKTNGNRKLYFELLPNTNISDYGQKGDIIYFKALLSMDKSALNYDYVPGYAEVKSIGTENGFGYILLEPGSLKDNGPLEINPIAISGIQFARNYLSRIIPPSSQTNPINENGAFLAIAKSLVGAFAVSGEFFTGPNKALWKEEIGTVMMTNKSWIRLNNPNNSKLGGGHRVKEIRTYDDWDNMVPNGEESFYGQQYEYEFEGQSSGVAAYEPQLGGEENVWRTYVANDIKMTWAPDIRNYMETPFGEQLFPTPSVGYSKVLVKNIERAGVVKTATGHTINEFYTAKDFPTITERTDVKDKILKYNVNALLFSMTRDAMAASQGFMIENNDMHGKPRLTEIYAEGQLAPYSIVEYYYQYENKVIDGISAKKLKNKIKVITPIGNSKNVIVGRTYEAVADFRENTSQMNSGNMGINLNFTLPFIVVPMILGANYSNSLTGFRSAVFAKTIERKGILHKTVAVDYGSKIETENLAYDSETGEVLLTSVNNGFRDTVYNFTYPAHWIYDGMGQAYKNLGYTSTITHSFVDGYCTSLTNSNLNEGDEVMVSQNGNFIKGWVTESAAIGIRILKKDGSPLDGFIDYLKVIRSGKRNLQSTPVGTIALMKNPLNSLTGNVFDEVLSAQSIEYDQDWKSFCDCNDSAVGNPYIAGLKGNWNPKATYLPLSDRTQTFENNNTNIRVDGMMSSFNPFFKLNNGAWSLNKENWTFTSEVTEFSPFGQAIETADALNRFSATHIGYNQSLPIAVASNSMRKESGFDGFEDYMFESCPDQHFKLGLVANINNHVAHTGRYSIQVDAGNPVVFKKQIAEICDEVDPCDFSNNIVGATGQDIVIMGSDGISFSYEVIYGSPIINSQGITGGVVYSFTSQQQNFKVEVKLINEEGCMEIITILEDRF